MRGHLAADLGLLADDHALENTGIVDAEGGGDEAVAGGEGDGAEEGVVDVEGVSDFVDGTLFGAGEGAGDEGGGLEEEVDCVRGGEEVAVADVGDVGGGEGGEGVVLEGEVW